MANPRFLLKHSIIELENLAETEIHDVSIQSQILHELSFRNTQRAEALRISVKRKITDLHSIDQNIPTYNVKSNEETPEIWRETVLRAFQDLGGEGSLSDIYTAVFKIRSDLPKSWKAIIRREIESASSDSHAFAGKFDYYRTVSGKGSGRWALRDPQTLPFKEPAVPNPQTSHYVVITESDESDWAHLTGEQYHFPKRYLKFLQPGTLVIYYKGTLKNRIYAKKRMSNFPHYFGFATIGENWLDEDSQKNDYFAKIENFQRFKIPVLAKKENSYLEEISKNRISNYWRDAVRPVSKAVFETILIAARTNQNSPQNSQIQIKQLVHALDQKLSENKGLSTRTNEILISDLVDNAETTVRLRNAISNAKALKILPTNSRSEYLKDPYTYYRRFLRLPNLGRKTAKELDQLLHSDESKLISITNPTNNVSPFDVLNQVHLKYILHLFDLSVRTQNFLKNKSFEELPSGFSFLGNYLERRTKAGSVFKTYQNVGRKTVLEISDSISEWLKTSLVFCTLSEEEAELSYDYFYNGNSVSLSKEKLLDVANLLKKSINSNSAETASRIINEKTNNEWEGLFENSGTLKDVISKFLSMSLDERSQDIIYQRYGLLGSVQTLEKLGTKYNVTRERVRQIQSKAIKRLRKIGNGFLLTKIFEHFRQDLRSSFFKDNDILASSAVNFVWRNLNPESRFLIELRYDKNTAFLNKEFFPVFSNGIVTSWTLNEKSETELDQHVKGLDKDQLLETLVDKRLPINFDKFCSNFPSQPPELVKLRLEKYFGAKTQGQYIISFSKLPVSFKLLQILTTAGRPLHTSELVNLFLNEFGESIEEHAASSNLQRIAEVVYVDRGTYGLYKNLPFDINEIETFRQQAYQLLKQIGNFVSSKNIYEELRLQGDRRLYTKMTPVLLHGILRDDTRFIIRRGYMVGLPTFSDTFKSLQEEVYEIIESQGPISPAEIIEVLSSARKVSPGTIDQAVMSYPNLFKSDYGTFDIAENIFGSIERFEKVKLAITVNLMRGGLSFFALRQKLDAVEIKLNDTLLKSIVQKDGLFYIEESVISLTSRPKEIAKYIEAIELGTFKSSDKNDMYASLDGFQNSAKSEAENPTSIVNSIFSDFGI